MDRDKTRTQTVGDQVTIQGAAQQLGLTFWQVDRLVRTGKVETIKVGVTRLVKLSDVELAAR
jgi:excisionase family DNA binding protein